MVVFWLLASIGIGRLSKSEGLVDNLVFPFVVVFIFGISILLLNIIFGDNLYLLRRIDVIVLIGCGVYCFALFSSHYIELAFIVKQHVLIWAYYSSIVGFLTFSETSLFFIISLILYNVGFMRFNKIKKRTKYDLMTWFNGILYYYFT